MVSFGGCVCIVSGFRQQHRTAVDVVRPVEDDCPPSLAMKAGEPLVMRMCIMSLFRSFELTGVWCVIIGPSCWCGAGTGIVFVR